MSGPSVLNVDPAEQPKHHPTLYRTGRFGCWGFCRCGWQSDVFPNVLSVHLSFGQHLVETAEVTP